MKTCPLCERKHQSETGDWCPACANQDPYDLALSFGPRDSTKYLIALSLWNDDLEDVIYEAARKLGYNDVIECLNRRD